MNINLTLIGQMITFALFVIFCMKYIWPPIVAAMEERAVKIADGLEAADRAGRDLELAQERATKRLHEAKEEAAVIIEAANKRGSQIVEEAKDQAREEGTRLKTAAQSEIEQEVNRAKEQLRGQVGALAISGAEKVLEASIDENAHKALVEKLAASL
ncbi:MAG: F-type H+-transporting ATPase subunit b [Gammaproteobacteria bacterium]